MTITKQRLLVFFVPLLLAAPFLNRAYFVDDHFFIEIARWIKDNPLHPYDFPTDGVSPDARASKEEIALRIVNPLLHHFYLAGLMKVGGESEWFLRFGCVLLSCFSGLFIFALARRWLQFPLLSTLLVQATPVHWLTSYSLLIDSTLAFFFLAALVSFIRGMERDSAPTLFLSGLCMAGALLTKYTGVLIFPLTAVWYGFHFKNLRRKWIYIGSWALGAMIFSAYALATKILYGQVHIITSSHAVFYGVHWSKILILLVFLSGSAIVPLLAWFGLTMRSLLITLAGLVSLIFFFMSSLGGFTLIQAILMALWLVTSTCLLVQFVMLKQAWQFPADHFLFVWVIGFLVMMTFVMPWTAARYFMIVIPALVFLTMRSLELKKIKFMPRLAAVGLTITALSGAALAYSDYQQAEASRAIVTKLRQQNLLDEPHNYYFSDAFTMTYLAKAGWRACGDPSQLNPGDRIITSDVSLPMSWFLRKRAPLRLLTVIEFPSGFPLKIMDSRNAAGFYASAWGPLPFALAGGPWERFYLFEIIKKS